MRSPAAASGVIVRIVTKNSWFVGNVAVDGPHFRSAQRAANW